MAGARCEVSVVIPAYKEAERIGKTLEVTAEELTGAGLSFELIVVDDGSPDNTAAVVEKYCGKRGSGRIRLVSYFPNQGKGFALKRGVYEASGKYIAFFDADLDISPDHIHRYLKILKKRKADGVIASKRHPDSKLEYSRVRTFISNIYYLFNRFFFRLNVKDTQSGMKIFRHEVLDRVVPRLLVKRFAFDLELLVVMLKEKAKIVEAPMTISGHQEYGRIGVMPLWHALVDTMAVFYRYFFLRYYDWDIIPAIRKKKPAVTILIDSPGYSNRLTDLIEYLQSGVLGSLTCVVLADRGAFSFPGVRVMETGSLSPREKLEFAIGKVKGQYFGFISDRVFPSPGWLLTAASYLSCKDIAVVAGPVQQSVSAGRLQRIVNTARLHPLVRGQFGLFYRLKRQRRIAILPPENFFYNKTALKKLFGDEPEEFIDDEGTPFLRIKEGAVYSPDLQLSSLPLFSGIRDYLRHIYTVSEYRGRYHGRGSGSFVILFLIVFFLTATVFALFSGVFRNVYLPFAAGVAGLMYLSGKPLFSPLKSIAALFLNFAAAAVKGFGVVRGVFSGRNHPDRS